MFPELFRRWALPLRLADDSVPGDIRLDVTENDNDYQVRAEIPGVKKEDIRVTVDGNFVSIVAEVKKEKEEMSAGHVLVKELAIGKASRGFSRAHELMRRA